MELWILVCTVGGSPQPVVTAVRELRPQHVVFVCSRDDPATGAKGSHTMVDATAADAIPARCGLAGNDFEVLLVPADDFQPAFQTIASTIDRLTAERPDRLVAADITGGTKTMTAALMLAAIDRPNVRLQLVTGTRDNLQRVRDGTQYVVTQDVAAVRTERAMRPFLDAWSRFAYDEAARGLDGLLPAAPPALRPLVQRLRDLSRGFAAWDRFDHTAARQSLGPYTGVVGDWLSPWLAPLGSLAQEERARREPLILIDLWHNAQRRAVQGRYDDAVGRCYRLFEWTAQWLWRLRHGISTDDFPAERVPPDLAGQIRPGRKGRIELGLWQSWQLLTRTDPDTPAARFFTAEDKTLLNHLERRNQSLLAHGFAPIGEEGWRTVAGWIAATFEPMLREEMKGARNRMDVPQLPDAPPLSPN